MCSMYDLWRVLALSSFLLCIPNGSWIHPGVIAAWEPDAPGGVVIRESGEPLHMLMTNNESYPSEYRHEGLKLQLPYELKTGAIVEATVINHANSNYPIIPLLFGYFEFLSENPSDIERLEYTNPMAISWSDPLLYPNSTYVLVARKLWMTDPECSDCYSSEQLGVYLLREDWNMPGDQPPNTTVYATSILKVLDPGEDVNKVAEFFSNPIVQVVCGVTLLLTGAYAGIRTGIRKERHRHRRAALDGFTVDGATIVASSQVGYCTACGGVLQSEGGSCPNCGPKVVPKDDDEPV